MIKVYIDKILVPEEDIVDIPVMEEIIELGNELFASSVEIVLNNTEHVYDIRNIYSNFYNKNWRNKLVEIYDNNKLLIAGKIKGYRLSDTNITIEISNVIRDMAETPIIYRNFSNLTWAGNILNIIKDPDIMNLSDNQIIMESFSNAINIQTANSAFGRINYTREHNMTVLPVLNEICRFTQCILYTSQNRIGLYQWVKNPVISQNLSSSEIIAGSFSITSRSDIINSVSMAYIIDNNVGRMKIQDLDLIKKHGLKTFNMPDRKINDDKEIKSYSMIFSSGAGARWAGNQVLDRFQNGILRCSWSTPFGYNLELNTTVNLDLIDYNVNVIVLSKEYLEEEGIIFYTGEIIWDEQ